MRLRKSQLIAIPALALVIAGFQNCAGYSAIESSAAVAALSSNGTSIRLTPTPVVSPTSTPVVVIPTATPTTGGTALPTPIPTVAPTVASTIAPTATPVATPAAVPVAAATPLGFTVKFLATSNTGYATAGFHPRVIANGKGVFVAYETDRNDSAVTETTHIDWSQDGGNSFTSLFSRVMSSSASSALQSDEAANLFMADLDQANQNARIFVFNGFNNFASAPAEFSVNYPSNAPPGSTKFSFFYMGNNVGYFADKHRLFALNFTTQTAGAPINLLVAPNATGLRGNPQYSNLAKTDSGQLLFGWTTQLVKSCASGDTSCTPSDLNGNYLDTHFMMSSDLGASWNNGASTLSLPVISDAQGSTGGVELSSPSDINLALGLQGDNFLHSLYSQGNYVHFVYMNKGGGGVAKYGRYNLVTKGIDIAPKPFRGTTITLNSNGITLLSQPGYPLYAVGATAHGDGTGSMAALVSDDDGVTWADYALDTSTPGNLQYMNASATLTTDHAIVGEFTKLNSADNTVYFFKLPARVLVAPVVSPPAHLYLKSFNGNYVSAPGGGGANSPLTVDKSSAQGWETFTLELLNSNQIVSGSTLYLETPTSYYASVQCGGGNDTASASCGRVQATVLSPSTYEIFTIEKIGAASGSAISSGDLVRLRSSSGYYCSAGSGGGTGSTFYCNGTSAGNWELFTVSW